MLQYPQCNGWDFGFLSKACCSANSMAFHGVPSPSLYKYHLEMLEGGKLSISKHNYCTGVITGFHVDKTASRGAFAVILPMFVLIFSVRNSPHPQLLWAAMGIGMNRIQPLLNFLIKIWEPCPFYFNTWKFMSASNPFRRDFERFSLLHMYTDVFWVK